MKSSQSANGSGTTGSEGGIAKGTITMKTLLFVTDGYPEAGDYDSNYIEYNPLDPASVEKAKSEARATLRAQAGRPTDDAHGPSGVGNLAFQPA